MAKLNKKTVLIILGILIILLGGYFLLDKASNLFGGSWELKYYDKAKEKALLWSPQAEICSLFISFDNPAQPNYFVYDFQSSEKKEMYGVSWSEKKSAEGRELPKDYLCDKLPQFPPAVSAKKALQLALSTFNKGSKEKVNLTKITMTLIPEYWRVQFNTDYRGIIKYPICYIFPDKKVNCR